MAKNKILSTKDAMDLKDKSRADQAVALLTTHGPLAERYQKLGTTLPADHGDLAYLLYLAWYHCRKAPMMLTLFPSEQLSMIGNRARGLLAVPEPLKFAHRLWMGLGANLTNIGPEDTIWIHGFCAELARDNGKRWRAIAKADVVNEALMLTTFLREALGEIHFSEQTESEEDQAAPTAESEPPVSKAKAPKAPAKSKVKNLDMFGNGDAQ